MIRFSCSRVVRPLLPFASLLAACVLGLAAPFAAPVAAATLPASLTTDAAADAPAILGTVTDTSGTPLSNAMIVLAELGLATSSNATGNFTLRGVAAGEYHLSVSLLGFAPGHAVVVVPSDGADVRVTVKLTPTPLRLQSVVVSASATGTESDRLTQAALELSGRALARSIGSSVASTLSGEPGVSQRFGGPAASMPVIRGLTGDRILVLQDGERTGDLASSSADHGVSVDPLAAQRIEVVRGPASLLYGNSALGGVVNVVSNDIPTVVPSHLEGYVASQGESVTPGGAISGSVTSAIGARSALTVRGSLRDLGALRTGDGVTLDGTDSQARSATLGYGFVGDRGTAGIALRYYDFNYGLPAQAGDPEAGVRLDGRRMGLSARVGRQLRSERFQNLKIEATAQDYAHDEIEPSGDVGTNFQLRTQTLNAQARTVLGRLTGAIGAQGLFKQYQATGEEALTPAANSTGLGVFLFQELPLRRDGDPESSPTLQVGARWDSYLIESKTGEAKFGPGRSLNIGSASGSIGVSVPFNEKISVSGSVARAFRAPTVEELYSNGYHAAAGSYDVGSPGLEAERSVGAEMVLRARGARVTAQVATYVNRIANYVTPTIVGDTLVDAELVPLNRFTQDDAQLVGAEASMELHVGRALVANVMGDLVRGEFTDGGALPFMPPARIGGGLRWESRGKFIAGDVRRGFAQNRVSGGSVDVPTAAYTLVNLSVGQQWLIGNMLHQLTLRADNVGDARYFDAASRIKRFAANPGRNITLVYQLQF